MYCLLDALLLIYVGLLTLKLLKYDLWMKFYDDSSLRPLFQLPFFKEAEGCKRVLKVHYIIIHVSCPETTSEYVMLHSVAYQLASVSG